MKTSTYIILFIVVIGLVWIYYSGEEDASEIPASVSAYATISEDGYQNLQLSYGKIGYSFNYILTPNTVKVNQPVRIIADASSLRGCYRYIQIPSYGISKFITSSDNIIEFTPTETGSITITCSMGMGVTKLTVEE
ncbi:MAG: hypothetical protein Q8R18_05750 [bacterium]|nr:hypothetical protein [bacterium]